MSPFALALALATATPTVLAQAPPRPAAQPVAPDDPQAEADYQRGAQAFRDRRYADARVAFGASVSRRPTPARLFAYGQACRNSGHYVDAVSAFERFLATPPAADDGQTRAQVRDQVALLRRSIVTLRVEVTPARFSLHVDGQAALVANGSLALDPGAHVIELGAEGHQGQRREVTLEAGQEIVLRVDLPAADARVVVEPDVTTATVTIDGRVAGRGRVDVELPFGDHLVEIEAAGYQPWRRPVRLDAAGTVRLAATLSRRGLPGWVLPVSIAGGVALVGGAIALGVALSSGGASDALPSDLHIIASAQRIGVAP